MNSGGIINLGGMDFQLSKDFFSSVFLFGDFILSDVEDVGNWSFCAVALGFEDGSKGRYITNGTKFVAH